MALFRRRFPKKVIVHSTRGSQYCTEAHRNILKKNNFIGAMNRKGNCWDNALSERFFLTLKIEYIQGQTFITRDQAKQEIFSYIESLL